MARTESSPRDGSRPSLELVDGGASNSRLTDTSVTPTRGGSGWDTVRLRFREQRGAYDRARAVGSAVHARGELRHTVAGVTVGAYPDGLVTVEARLAALLHGEGDHRLMPSEALREAPGAAADLFGLDVDAAPVGVGRADLASELVFPDAELGLEFLRALSYVDLPWLKVGTEGGKRTSLETVYHRSARGRSVAFRCYDKGRESETAVPGTWLRLERQRRWRKDREPAVEDLLERELVAEFAGRELRSIVAGGEGVTVCDRDAAVFELRRRHARGELTGAGLHRLTAYVTLGEEGLDLRTSYRRAAELRGVGLALNPHEGGRSVVPVAEYLREFVSAWAA